MMYNEFYTINVLLKPRKDCESKDAHERKYVCESKGESLVNDVAKRVDFDEDQFIKTDIFDLYVPKSEDERCVIW